MALNYVWLETKPPSVAHPIYIIPTHPLGTIFPLNAKQIGPGSSLWPAGAMLALGRPLYGCALI